ncbi:LysR family transcriptional regulator [Herbaspirillum sp. B65]|jgi:DNA-binding transcriptional LysR family regulator|uniref:LysR family transcriptional regulator n=1 Tax=Herbaspirillum sp. B65 TaxID=137708 RepID=UPI0003492144|nr:LysR family transcriptional regulator [Herbaspirillum sp. B65]
MANFDLNLLPIALAIFEERSVSAAARRLDMSQPAVSVALNKLRSALGDPLFVKTGSGMQPTPRAYTLIDPTREILQRVQAEVLASQQFTPATTTRRFVLALSDIGELMLLPRLLARLRDEAPHASVATVTMAPDDLVVALESGEVDLAIGYFPDLKKRNFFQQRLFSQDFVCLLRADHPLLAQKISLDHFLDMGHIVIKAEGRDEPMCERFLLRRKIRRRVVLSTSHCMAIPLLIASSDLIATVPRGFGEFVTRVSNVRLVEPGFEMPSLDLKQHWHRKYHKDGSNAWLRALTVAMFPFGTEPMPPQSSSQRSSCNLASGARL